MGLPRWGVPPICRPILRQGAVELVDYTNDGFIVSLKASTGLNLDWNCYVNQHDSGYGGSRLRPFVSILFAYWYLPLAGLLQPEPPGLEVPEQHRDPVGMYRAHLASAICAKCDYFITTDDRLLRYATDKIKIVNPVQFITEEE